MQAGRPFLLFGDGRLTACKPISDEDLAAYIADCLHDPSRHNASCPTAAGGRDHAAGAGEALFALTGRKPSYRHVPVAVLDAIIAGLGFAGRLVPSLADKAELARIGRYYATESMLVLDEVTGRYDADATPSTGTQTLFDYYARVLRGETARSGREHACSDP